MMEKHPIEALLENHARKMIADEFRQLYGSIEGDIPQCILDLLKTLDEQTHRRRGSGILADITSVQRINTHGGALQGACDQLGSFRSVPYSADYSSFLSKDDHDYTATIPRPGQDH
jgi:hypothetical protein